MYKYIICFFSFLLITQEVWTGTVRESQRRLSCSHMSQGTNLQQIYFSFFCQVDIFQMLTQILHGHTSSSLPLTFHPSMPPTEFPQHFCQDHLCPIYFRYHMHFLLFLFNQGPTSAAVSIDVKGVFKSISNNSIGHIEIVSKVLFWLISLSLLHSIHNTQKHDTFYNFFTIIQDC